MKGKQLQAEIERINLLFPTLSKKSCREIILERIEKDATELFIANVRKNIEYFLTEKGLEFSYITTSETNFGTSIYYRVNDVKYRFSDHSVTNYDRIFNEEHFNLQDFAA